MIFCTRSNWIGIIIKQIYDLIIWDPNYWQVLPFQIWVDLGVMTMKMYTTFLRYPELWPHHQIQFTVRPKSPLFRYGILLLWIQGRRCFIFRPTMFDVALLLILSWFFSSSSLLEYNLNRSISNNRNASFKRFKQ